MIFVDTGAWFASFVASDPDHAAAGAWLDANTHALVTTDYVIDELLTLLKIRGELERALEIGGYNREPEVRCLLLRCYRKPVQEIEAESVPKTEGFMCDQCLPTAGCVPAGVGTSPQVGAAESVATAG